MKNSTLDSEISEIYRMALEDLGYDNVQIIFSDPKNSPQLLDEKGKPKSGTAYVDGKGIMTLIINAEDPKNSTRSGLIGTLSEEGSHVIGKVEGRQIATGTAEKGLESTGRATNEYFQDKYRADDTAISIQSDGKDYSGVDFGENVGDKKITKIDLDELNYYKKIYNNCNDNQNCLISEQKGNDLFNLNKYFIEKFGVGLNMAEEAKRKILTDIADTIRINSTRKSSNELNDYFLEIYKSIKKEGVILKIHDSKNDRYREVRTGEEIRNSLSEMYEILNNDNYKKQEKKDIISDMLDFLGFSPNKVVSTAAGVIGMIVSKYDTGIIKNREDMLVILSQSAIEKKFKRELEYKFNTVANILDNPKKINQKLQIQRDIIEKIYNIYYPFVKLPGRR